MLSANKLDNLDEMDYCQNRLKKNNVTKHTTNEEMKLVIKKLATHQKKARPYILANHLKNY
jgi:hypothetical protein